MLYHSPKAAFHSLTLGLANRAHFYSTYAHLIVTSAALTPPASTAPRPIAHMGDHTVSTSLALLAAQAPLEPGQLLEDVRLTVRGILRARRDHSASISFLELSDGTEEAGQMLQVCINRAKCDDTPSTKHALEQLNIGDTLCCSGPPGRTRTVPVATQTWDATLLRRSAHPMLASRIVRAARSRRSLLARLSSCARPVRY